MLIHTREELEEALKEHKRAIKVAEEWEVSRQRIHQLMKKYQLTDDYHIERQCSRCQHEWIGVRNVTPKICPKCKSVRWADEGNI